MTKLFTETLKKKAVDYAKQRGIDEKQWSLFESHEAMSVKGMNDAEPSCPGCEIGEIIKIKGYLSTFKNVDRYGDVVASTAFDECLKLKKVYPLQRDHNYGTDDFVGDFVAAVDDKGLYIEGELLCTPGTLDLCMKVKSGKLNTVSMGGMFRYASKPDKNGNAVIEEVMLLEGSIVPIPANEKAEFSVKSLSEKAEEVPTEPRQLSVEERASSFKKFREGENK